MVISSGIYNNILWQPSNTWVFAIGVLTYPEVEDWRQLAAGSGGGLRIRGSQ